MFIKKIKGIYFFKYPYWCNYAANKILSNTFC